MSLERCITDRFFRVLVYASQTLVGMWRCHRLGGAQTGRRAGCWESGRVSCPLGLDAVLWALHEVFGVHSW